MRLEPVYLVAPKPAPPSVPTRRAFLIAGGTFLAGAALGGACGYAAGVGGAEEQTPSPANDDTPPPSGDAELDELRRLALKAPIEELASKWLYFGDVFSKSYRRDPYLPTGINRIIDHLVATPSFDRRKVAAQFMRDIIVRGEPDFRRAMEHRLMDLSTIR